MKILEVLSEIIINAGIAHGFLVALLFGVSRHTQARVLLIFLLIDLSLIVFRIHYLNDYLFDTLGYTFFGAGPFLFLLAPLLFLYLRSIVLPEERFSKNDLVHFIASIVFVLLAIPTFVDGKDGFYSLFLGRIIGSPWAFLVIQFFFYLAHARRLLKAHKKNIVEKFSNVEGMDVSWLNLLIWIFILVLFFITVATPGLIHGINLPSFYTTSAIFFSLLLFFIAYRGIQQRIPVETVPPTDNGTASSDDATIEQLKEKLLTHMVTSKPFLNPELTLIDLARQVDLSRNQLSLVINTGIGNNFYNFINEFRIQEVKELIEKDSTKKYTLLSLATDAGFNSKSSFNNIFKKITGLTPSEYRNGQV